MKKPGYPRTINGTLIFSEDKRLSIPELELSFSSIIDNHGNRKISHVSARFPDRRPTKVDKCIRQTFEKGNIQVDFNDNKEVYSMTLYSINSLLGDKVGKRRKMSAIESYVIKEDNVELKILLQNVMQCWGILEDIEPHFIAGGVMTELAIAMSEGEEISPDDIPEMPPGLPGEDIPEIDDESDNTEDDGC